MEPIKLLAGVQPWITDDDVIAVAFSLDREPDERWQGHFDTVFRQQPNVAGHTTSFTGEALIVDGMRLNQTREVLAAIDEAIAVANKRRSRQLEPVEKEAKEIMDGDQDGSVAQLN